MSIAQRTPANPPRKPLRLWPGLTAAVLLVVVRFLLPLVAPSAEFLGLDAALLSVIGGLLFAVLVFVWWIFFSRAPWSERFIAIGVMAVSIVAIRPLVHVSIQGGMQGMMFYIYAVPPTLALALVIWAAATRGVSAGPRRVALVVALLVGSGVWTLARTNGILGGIADLEWRWTPTAEELLLAETRNEAPLPSPAVAAEMAKESIVAKADEPASSAAVPATPALESPAKKTESAAPAAAKAPAVDATSTPVFKRPEWPGFRGPERDGVVHGVIINTDWAASPPKEMWRRPIGPGWSSFAVSGDLLYTQEQRGDDEIVACYRVSTGEPVWRHGDPIRFYESNGGTGPRGTPTLNNGRIYAMGATGLLNALNARDGSRIWARNAATDTGVEVPGWGISSSPLVIDDEVIVAVSGQLVAYDAATGERHWLGPTGGSGYSSPHLMTIDGVPQVLLLRGSRTISVAPADGKLLWEHRWDPGVGIVQPALAANGDVLITVGDGMGGLGMRRVAIAHGPSEWTVEERWTSRGLKPYFNDFVVHQGHAYGFDGNILSSINLENGARNWKGGRYGNGQMLLLADQDLLLVQSEEGELALVSATPDKFTEVARLPVFDAKTWNHPVLVGDVLLVRNGEEMAAFRLALARNSTKDTIEEK